MPAFFWSADILVGFWAGKGACDPKTMQVFKYVITNILETLLRIFLFPCKTGLIRIGNPDKNSPVILTCNFHLTVERVKRALQGVDCYLLVANSQGINVWCAAAGGHFTSHDVVSVLKTSGIEDLVDHRNLILPQLGATGIEAKLVQQKAGWKVCWGPVYAKDIPEFLQNGFKKTKTMRQVNFSLAQRIEMALFWAFPISLILALIVMFFWQDAVLPLLFLTWGLALIILISFPLYAHLIGADEKRRRFPLNFERGGLQLILWTTVILGLLGYTVLTGGITWNTLLRWGILSGIVIFILSIDLRGFTPVFRSDMLENSRFNLILDTEKCCGDGVCEQVCPRNCFDIDVSRRIAIMARADLCIRCGACIVQCPCDALYFKNSKGESISPETIRKFKLNLLGKRRTNKGKE